MGAAADWLGRTRVAEGAGRTTLLGLPAAAIPSEPAPPTGEPVLVSDGGPRRPTSGPFVVDLSLLWEARSARTSSGWLARGW